MPRDVTFIFLTFQLAPQLVDHQTDKNGTLLFSKADGWPEDGRSKSY